MLCKVTHCAERISVNTSPAGLGWPADGDRYLMHKTQLDGWHVEEKGWPEASTMNDSANTLSMQMMLNQTMLTRTLA